MVSSELELKVQSVLLLLEALAYLGLAGWCFDRGRGGRWAAFAGTGALVLGIVFGVTAAASAELVFMASSHIYDDVLFHEHLGTALVVARLLGVLLLGWGVVQSRRTPPAPVGSIPGA
jgi:hypothetical protein